MSTVQTSVTPIRKRKGGVNPVDTITPVTRSGGVKSVDVAIPVTRLMLDFRKKSEGKGCILSLPEFEIGLSDNESRRIGAQFAQVVNIQSMQFPDAMCGCGLYNRDDEKADTVVAMIHAGRVTADKFIIVIWADVDKQTRMYGISRNTMLKWIDSLYDIRRDAKGNIIHD